MGEIAAIFGWGPDTLMTMEIEDLAHWHNIAVTTWNRMNRSEK